MIRSKTQQLCLAFVKRFELRRERIEKLYSEKVNACILQEMQQLAKVHGGICLSKKYAGGETKLRWRCAEGHQWEAIAFSIRRGSWCKICGSKRAGKLKALTIQTMRKIAAKRGGECISKTYTNNLTKLRWRCKTGHEWDATPASIVRGSWCKICAGKLPKHLALEQFQKLAISRGGLLISKRYKHSHSVLLWQCAKGHRWNAAPNSVKAGSWCRVCAGSAPLNIHEMQKAARNYGGQCLSKNYVNVNTHLRWRCVVGHEFPAKPYHVMDGHWCPICSSGISERICRAFLEHMTGVGFPKSRPAWLKNDRGRQMELDGYAEELNLAFEYQGVQHYKPIPFIESNKERLKQRQQDDRRKRELCSENGVTLMEIPYDVQHKNLHEYILNSLKRVNPQAVTDSSPIEISELGVWKPKDLEELQKLAVERGGKLLSKFYINNQTKLWWSCSEGHEWEAIPSSVKRGSWCRLCSFKVIAAKRLKHTIEEMRSLAKANGGLCLSEKYLGFEIKLKWRCANGHEWEVAPSSILSGHWCQKCSHQKHFTPVN